MFLRRYQRTKQGKTHTYYALVESVRTDAGPRQRVVAHLGELNHDQERRWQRTVVFHNRQGEAQQLRLFPDDESVPLPDDPDSVRIRLGSVGWTNPRLAMGFGNPGEFDFGGCVIGAFLYQSYDIKAPRMLKQRDGKYWTLYGCYAKQDGYEVDPGSEGVATSGDGLAWTRVGDKPILSVQDPDCGEWEKACIYQPWLIEHEGRYYNFYNAKQLIGGYHERMGLATSTNLLDWKRYGNNPVLDNRPGGYDDHFCADGKVFRDGDHWVMFYFGVGKGGAHIMVAFSRDLQHWTANPEPLYKAGGNPSGLDSQYAHKISVVYNPKNETFYLFYCACGNQGRSIGLITSKSLPSTARPDSGQ